MKIFICLLGFITVLTSCEGNTTRRRHITNNTSSTIHVIATGSDFTDFDEFIAPYATKELFFTQRLGGSSHIEDPAWGVDSMIITNSSADTCTKDFTLQDNWDIRAEQKKKIPSDWRHEYTFILTDSDF